MCNKLKGIVTEATAWCEGCPCRRDLRHSRKQRWQQQLFDRTGNEQRAGAVFSCPCGGKNAPFMACGDFEVFLQQISQLTYAEMMASASGKLSDAEIASLVADFEGARAHLLQGFAAKNAYWRMLPWQLCGLAHPDEGKAKSAARCTLLK